MHSMGYLCVCIRNTMFANLQVSVKLAYLDGYRLLNGDVNSGTQTVRSAGGTPHDYDLLVEPPMQIIDELNK